MQLPLNIQHEHEFGCDDFIVSCCNLEAFNLLHNSISWHDNRLIILGEEGSGKTHLTKIWQQESSAVVLREGYDFSALDGTKTSIIIEDIEQIKNEEYLFHLINFAKNNSESLLMTASSSPCFKLNDLQSRINATHKALIKKPDDELISIVLHI